MQAVLESLALSTHIRWLTTIHDSSFRQSNPLLWYSEGTHMYAYRHIYMYIKKNTLKLK